MCQWTDGLLYNWFDMTFCCFIVFFWWSDRFAWVSARFCKQESHTKASHPKELWDLMPIEKLFSVYLSLSLADYYGSLDLPCWSWQSFPLSCRRMQSHLDFWTAIRALESGVWIVVRPFSMCSCQFRYFRRFRAATPEQTAQCHTNRQMLDLLNPDRDSGSRGRWDELFLLQKCRQCCMGHHGTGKSGSICSCATQAEWSCEVEIVITQRAKKDS